MKRQLVPSKYKSWLLPYSDYNPFEYTSPKILQKKDGSRLDFMYSRPINPNGRTGMTGRNNLYNWGTNHTADVIVSNFVNDDIEILLINRKDTGDLAFIGGFLDFGEIQDKNYHKAAQRELLEEAFDNNTNADVILNDFFYKVDTVYRGYVDDPRNTDNAWIETKVFHLPLRKKSEYMSFNNYLKAGDDAKSIGWYSVENILNKKMYASHSHILRDVMRDIKRVY
jgi:ADP-ribose pyrophosphatase